MAQVRCLLVEDDAQTRALVAEHLQGFGIEVQAVASGAALRAALLAGPPSALPDVIVLDLMLPDARGLDLCRELRHPEHRARGVPIVMLTAQGDPMSRVVGLEMGADDYLGKPFEPRELVARIHAVLRRTRAPGGGGAAPAQAAVLHFSGWVFDRLRRTLCSPAQVVLELSAAEFRLLSVLVDHPRQVLSRERLLDLTRAPGVEVSERSIDLAISRLRSKLGGAGGPADDAGAADRSLIRTVRGEGYLFDTRVSA